MFGPARDTPGRLETPVDPTRLCERSAAPIRSVRWAGAQARPGPARTVRPARTKSIPFLLITHVLPL